jgi:hypothetical protein
MRSDCNRYVRRFGAVMAAAVAAAAMTWATAIFAQSAIPAYLAAFPNFAPRLTPQLPGDVDITLKTQLEKAGEFAKVQREFDLNAWQMFLALNWLTDDQGRAAPKIEDTRFGPRTGRYGTTAARSFGIMVRPPRPVHRLPNGASWLFLAIWIAR